MLGCTKVDEALGDEPEPEDIEIPWTRRPGHMLPVCEETEVAKTPPESGLGSTLRSTIALDEAEVDDENEDLDPSTEIGEAAYLGLGFGSWDLAEGEPHMLRWLPTMLPAARPVERKSLAWFAVLSDFQLGDDESPARIASDETPEHVSLVRPQEAYLPRALTAMNRTLRQIAMNTRPFDFGIITGDCTDSAQFNELRWMIDLMDGKAQVHVDSGNDDDPVPGANNDPKDAFDGVAFPAPWLYVPGNHDALVAGRSALTPDTRALAVGDHAQNGTRDYRQWFAPIVTDRVPADANRRPLTIDEAVAELHVTEAVPGPVGHGYGLSPPNPGRGDYRYEALPGLLRVLVLDTSDRDGGTEGIVPRSAFEGWLLPELEMARMDGVLVLLASHHSTTSIDQNAGDTDTVREDTVGVEELEAAVAAYPEVVAWLVGHSHDHRVRAIENASGSYWEIMTSSLMDFPNQARIVELVANADGTVSLFSSTVDFRAESCLERRFRRLSMIDHQSGFGPAADSKPEDRNVELLIRPPQSVMPALERHAASASNVPESLSPEMTQ
jgi:3',5'-cyclic AMP phosphodiesterase CpdA